MATVYCSEEEIRYLQSLLGTTPRRIVAPSFEVSVNCILSTRPDGSVGIEYESSHTGLLRYLNIENNLTDVEGAWDVPKLMIKEQEAPRDFKVRYPRIGEDMFSIPPEEIAEFSSLELSTTAIVETIELWEMVTTYKFTADDRELEVSSDTGIRIILGDGSYFAFTVDSSIVCQVKFASTEVAVTELLDGMRLRRKFSLKTDT